MSYGCSFNAYPLIEVKWITNKLRKTAPCRFGGREYSPTIPPVTLLATHCPLEKECYPSSVYMYGTSQGEAQDHSEVRALTQPIRLNTAESGLKHFYRRGDQVAALALAEAAEFANTELVPESDASGSGSGSGSDEKISSNLFLYRLSSLLQ